MPDRCIENARINAVFLGIGDHGPDAWLHLEMDGTGQGFGGYNLRSAAMSVFVLGVLDALDERDWMKLVGKYCRVDHDSGKIYRIGHLIKDKWFDPVEAFKVLGTLSSKPT